LIDKISEDAVGRGIVHMKENAYSILLSNPEEWRQCRRREDTTKMYLKGIGYEIVDWIHLAYYRYQSELMNLPVG
jgi:hypothetical protein